MMHTPSRPGKIIREELIDTLRLSITEAADKLAMSRTALSRVLSCRAAAKALSFYFIQINKVAHHCLKNRGST